MIICADIGGTKTKISEYSRERKTFNNVKTFKNIEFSNQYELFENYLITESVEGVMIGVAGQVINGKCHLTNLDWNLSEEGLREYFNIKECHIANDLEILAYSSTDNQLKTESILANNSDGNSKLIVAAGTGFGLSFVSKREYDKLPIVIPSEGGHSGFSPSSDIGMKIFEELYQKNGYVSIEHILSGRGIINIFNLLKKEYEKLNLPINATTYDAETIANLAKLKNNDIFEKTLNVFFELYGSIVNDLALIYCPTSGIYIGGGIAQKNLSDFKDNFLTGYIKNKPEHRGFLTSIKIELITDELAMLRGCVNKINDF